jgi:hypothetical protein
MTIHLHRLIRGLVLAAAGLCVALAFSGQASAATSNVKLLNQATGAKLLTKDPSGLASMKNPGTPNQIWTRTDTNSGYATYAIGTGCLTGRGLQGAPVVTIERCVAGATRQQWRKGVSGDLQLRLNGLVAEVNTANASNIVRMAFFQVKPNQRWTIVPA